jgi:type IV pilus assembly protein PilM/plasmid segregation protein ParM
LIIDFGEDSADLSMVYGAPRLVRMLPGGLSVLVRTVANSLNVKESQARQFILKFGLAQDKLDGQVFKALDNTLENFASELTKSVRFFQTKYPNVSVGGIVLSGFAGVIPFMAEYIEAKTGIQTIQGNPWQMVKVTPQQQQALSQVAAEFAVAIGLAERSNTR